MNSTALSLKTLSDLRECYNNHSHKFSSTRKKKRPELEYVIQYITLLSQNLNKPLHIVELGCGDGRLYRTLVSQYPDCIASYTGVDISSGLLTIAEQQSPTNKDHHRREDDMIHYLDTQPSESIDIIITMASYQHLPDQETRNQYLQQVYRTLGYKGQWISVDWSWSWWMINKHYKPLLQSLKKSITTFGYRKWNNLMIPFTDQGKTHKRLYHIHTYYEIKKILTKHNLQLVQRSYSSQNGDFHHNIFRARNICFVAQKTIYPL